ncbi:hypothetical protein [Aneurinibacillus tyrosinisolvens]|uniref:hypothetical protein n=1 Tax=Aneurinibacillus tyrosinisolvens TaxID=1443435 RepID=UPI00063FA39B|nr:hypothetical protein [Aneurinibacillus tyrosinisolvens]
MPLDYQILLYFAVGLTLYFALWRKKGIISAILNVLNYLGVGLLFYGIGRTDDVYSYIGGAIMLLTVIAFFFTDEKR